MAEFSANASRFDPYKNFRFRVKWDGRYVAGASTVGGIKRTSEVVTHREGSDPSRVRTSRGRTGFEAITMERGVTRDADFERWVEQGSDRDRRDFVIEVFNEAGQSVLAYKVLRAWISDYQAVPELDANAHAVAIQRLTLQNEGWERDYSVSEPSEPEPES